MKDLFDQLEEPKGDKIAKLVADMKSVSAEMGMGIEDLVEKVKSECCGDMESEESEGKEMAEEKEDDSEEMSPDNGQKKAVIIAMLKRKAGKM
jgi:predicted GTPase